MDSNNKDEMGTDENKEDKQHDESQEAVSTDDSAAKAQAAADEAENLVTDWSWGAFMFDLPFLIAVRKYTYILIYLLMIIPILNFIVYVGLKIYLGIKGRELAKNSETFADESEVDGFFKGFDWAGKVLFFVMLAVFVLGLILSFVAGAGALDAMPGIEMHAEM